MNKAFKYFTFEKGINVKKELFRRDIMKCEKLSVNILK